MEFADLQTFKPADVTAAVATVGLPVEAGTSGIAGFRYTAPDYGAIIAKAKDLLSRPEAYPAEERVELTHTLFMISMSGSFTMEQRRKALELGRQVRKTLLPAGPIKPAHDYAATVAIATDLLRHPEDYSVTEGLGLADTLFAISMDGRFTQDQRTNAYKVGNKVFEVHKQDNYPGRRSSPPGGISMG